MSFKIVGCITREEEIGEAAALSDLIEWRVDLLGLPKRPIENALFTFKHRLDLLKEALELNPLWCDVEQSAPLSLIEKLSLRYPKVRWIRSHHDFEKTPRDLDAILSAIRAPVFSLYKLAFMAQSTQDMLRLLLFCKKQEDVAAISMGPYGRPSRVLGAVFHSKLCYAGLKDDPVLGRYSLQDLHDIYRIRTMVPDMPVFALIGDPVEQSPGHRFHNAAFKGRALYVKLRVDKEALAECFSFIREANFKGLSVTRPLKEAIVSHLDETHVSPVNTVLFTPKAVGFNTDGLGAIDALQEDIKGKHIAILGAGGTAKAIAQEAQKQGATVTMFSRQTLPSFGACDYDILINTVPERLEVPLRENKTVLDVVYSETALLERAARMKCKCVHGNEMFASQAIRQQELWSQA